MPSHLTAEKYDPFQSLVYSMMIMFRPPDQKLKITPTLHFGCCCADVCTCWCFFPAADDVVNYGGGGLLPPTLVLPLG